MINSQFVSKLVCGTNEKIVVPTSIHYQINDPFAIRLSFTLGGDVVEWLFARSLLDAGIRGDAGIGDVRLWPSIDCVNLSLTSPEGTALLELPTDCLLTFLERSFKLVPSGTECIDWDRAFREFSE